MKANALIAVFSIALLSEPVFSGTTEAPAPAKWNVLRGAGGKPIDTILQGDLSGRDADGNSALHVAALHGSSTVMRKLLERGT